MTKIRPVDELLSKIQRDLKAPKDQFNGFGKYNYRNKENIIEAVKPHLVEGAYINDTDEILLIGNRFYIKTTASIHFKGESVSATAYAREADTKKGMDGAQLTGACSSYSGKYAYGKLFALDDTKCIDSASAEQNNDQEIKAKVDAKVDHSWNDRW